MRTRALLAVALAAIVSLALVAGSVAAGKPSVSFTSPSNGATTGSRVTFKVKPANFKLDGRSVGKRNRAGRGHIHFAMDGGRYDFPRYSGANGKIAVQLGVQGKYSPAVAPTITYKGLPRGKHTLKVFLVNNDHTNVRGATDTIRFTVR